VWSVMQPHAEDVQWECRPCHPLGQQRLGEDSAPWCWEMEMPRWAFSKQPDALPEELHPPLCEGSALLRCHPGRITIWVTFFSPCLPCQLGVRPALSPCFTLPRPTGAGRAAGRVALLREGLPGPGLDPFGESNTQNSGEMTRAVTSRLLPRGVLLFSKWA